jgi:hypothetical protein
MKYQTKASVALDRARGYKGGETDVSQPVEKKTILNPAASQDPNNRSGITVNGVDMSQKEYAQLNRAKQSGVAPLNPNLTGLFNQAQKESAARADQRLMEQLVQQDILAKKTAAIQGQLNPQVQAQDTGVNLNPEVEADKLQGIAGQTLTAGLKAGASGAAGAALTGGIGGAAIGGVGAIPGAIGGAIVGGVGGFVGGAIYGGFSAAKENKKDYLNQAGSLGTDAESGMQKTIQQAAQGMDEITAVQNFQKDVEYLLQAEANMQQLIKTDESYYDKKGRDEMRQIQDAKNRLNFYNQKLSEAIMNNKNKMATDMSQMQQVQPFNPAQND